MLRQCFRRRLPPHLTRRRACRQRAAAATAGGLPDVANKPEPRSSTLRVGTNTCGPRGDDRGDQDLNFLKNRIDEADEWLPVDIGAVVGQPYPPGVPRKPRAEWKAADLAAVKRYEGLPISVVGYFAWAQDEKEESCNCHIDDPAAFDIHCWLTAEPVQDRDRRQALVVEVTPRLKRDHPNWNQTAIRKLVRQGAKVRVSGWLMLDQEHPEQIGKMRGTLWEVHPVMEIEVWDGRNWVPLDDM